MPDTKTLLSNFKKGLEGVVGFCKKEIATLHVGVANPEIIQDLKVSYMGSQLPLKAIASLSAPDPATLKIEPWDKSATQEIEKVVSSSPIGLSVSVQGRSIFAKLPPMSEERRRGIIKILGQKIEESKIKIRVLRDDAWKEIQLLEKQKQIGEDEKFRAKDEMEKEVKRANENLEFLKITKEKEIL